MRYDVVDDSDRVKRYVVAVRLDAPTIRRVMTLARRMGSTASGALRLAITMGLHALDVQEGGRDDQDG